MAEPEMGEGEMPAEKIYSSKGDIDIRVAWGNHRSDMIQVATLVRPTTDFDPTRRIISIVNEWLVAAGEQPLDLDAITKKLADKARANGEIFANPFFDGYHATIESWSEANDLIRVLRRARDTVFGKPE